MYSRYSLTIVRLCSALMFVAVLHEWVSVAATPQTTSNEPAALQSPIKPMVQAAYPFQVFRKGLPRRREGGGTRYTL